MTTNH